MKDLIPWIKMLFVLAIIYAGLNIIELILAML